LYDGFRRYRGTSPMKLVRTQRMLMVRQELIEHGDKTTVTDAALKWGFNHLGRFSAYYKAQFGEKPSDTLRLARSLRLTNGPPPRQWATK
jgi:AraC-like DNA-binding protein